MKIKVAENKILHYLQTENSLKYIFRIKTYTFFY